ncbi:MAG: hypothetical protein OEU32_18445, partial [Acidimicrobiia bacterium]|nr:hypothetical protein [Acidimicrobiia bacterium]
MRLLVAGMHRSGTSAVGRLLSELGVATAAPDDLLGADDHNRLGHYEISDLTELNDELLAAIGAHWAAPPTAAAFDAQIELAGGPLGRRAGELVDAKLPPDDWFWKDPRLSVLLPFWREILPEEPAVIWVHRHPAAVARSLQKRNRFGLDIGAALWERYTQLLRAGSAGLATHIVGFDGLIETPDITASALEAFVVDVGLDIAPRESRDAVVAGERHHSDVVIDLTPAQEELLAEISAHIDRRVPLEWASADARPEPTVPISASAPLVIAADDEVERLSVELAESRRDSQAQLDRLHAELEEARRLAQTDLDRVNTELEETRESARADLDRVNTELEEARRLAQTDLDRVNTELEEVRRLAQSALDQGARERLEATAAIDELQVALGLTESELGQTQERLSVTTTELAHLTALHDAEIGSNTHQLIAAYRRAVGRALPPESQRREAYVGAVGGARRLVRRVRPDQPAHDPAPAPVSPAHQGVVLELADEPDVSVVIPVHGNVDITRRLLESIAAHTTGVAYEAIIVDDESPDEMPDFL